MKKEYLKIVMILSLLKKDKIKFYLIIKKKKYSSPFTLFHNETGTSLLSPLILSLIFSLGTLCIMCAVKENAQIKDRSEVYLCLKILEKKRRSYIKTMANLNKVIFTFFSLSLIPSIRPYAKKMQQTAQRIQDIYHFSHLKNYIGFKSCSKVIRLNYFINMPYKLKGKVFLLRNNDGTISLKAKKWSEYLWSKKVKIFMKSEYSLKSRFSPKVDVKRQEFSKLDLLTLKASSGPALSSFQPMPL